MAITEKTKLRNHYRQERNALSPELRAQWSAAISERILAHPSWLAAQTILSYVSFGTEVETRSLMRSALQQGKRLIVPMTDHGHLMPILSEVLDLEHLVEGAVKGIHQPAPEHKKVIAASEVDYVLLPGLAFDRRGGRLGMGGGFYDRLLPQIPEAVFIALAFSVQIHPRPLPCELHDVCVHSIVTESYWIEAETTS